MPALLQSLFANKKTLCLNWQYDLGSLFPSCNTTDVVKHYVHITINRCRIRQDDKRMKYFHSNFDIYGGIHNE